MEDERKSEETVTPAEPPDLTAPASVTDPKLTANLLASYAALQNDVQQARELASDFQSQLAGKSNEYANLKRVFGETKSHLTRLEANIAELREERHRLAGEAMRAVALERRLTERDAEISALKNQIETLQKPLTPAAADRKTAANGERDRQPWWRSWFRGHT